MKRIRPAFAAVLLVICVSACGTAEIPRPTDAGPSADSGLHETYVPPKESEPPIPTAQQGGENAAEPYETANETEQDTAMKMNVQVGDKTFTATLEDNAAAREFIGLMQESPVSIEMSDYSGFEKVGPLGRSLTEDNSRITTDAGDIVLYNGDNIVMFYGSNSWSYTRLGHIDDLTGWEEALGSGRITAVFSIP